MSAEKETQLLLAEQEMERVQLCLDTSVKAKAKALSDLDSAFPRPYLDTLQQHELDEVCPDTANPNLMLC